MLFYLVGIFVYLMYVCEVCVCEVCVCGGAHASGSQFLPSALLETVSLQLPRPAQLACQLLFIVLPPRPPSCQSYTELQEHRVCPSS